jgi:hypothetical protein
MRIDAPLFLTTWLSLVGDQLRKHNPPLRGFLAKWNQGQHSCSKRLSQRGFRLRKTYHDIAVRGVRARLYCYMNIHSTSCDDRW